MLVVNNYDLEKLNVTENRLNRASVELSVIMSPITWRGEIHYSHITYEKLLVLKRNIL